MGTQGRNATQVTEYLTYLFIQFYSAALLHQSTRIERAGLEAVGLHEPISGRMPGCALGVSSPEAGNEWCKP